MLIACHRLNPTAWPGDGLWYDERVKEERVLVSWSRIALGILIRAWILFRARILIRAGILFRARILIRAWILFRARILIRAGILISADPAYGADGIRDGSCC